MNSITKNSSHIVAIALVAIVLALGAASYANAATGGGDGAGGGCCGGSSGGGGGWSGGGGGGGYDRPEIKAPTCSLSASDTSITKGESVTLTWSSHNAFYAYMSNVGSINLSGSTTVSPQQTTTYTATFTGENNKQVTCKKTIYVSQPPVVAQPTCSLNASPATITRGNSATLNWSSTNASYGSINQGVGSVGLSGSRVVSPQYTTTYTGTFTAQGGGQVTCTATVYVNEPPVYNPAPTCNIYVNNYNQNYQYNYQYQYNQPVTIYWSSNNASYGWLNQGLGSIALSGNRVVYPTQTTTYTATFVGYGGEQVTCSVTVNVNTYVPPPVYPPVYQNPAPYVYLSAVPYTGLDLGPVGTALYWAFLVAWCALAAYLIAVKRVHVSIYRWYSGALFGSAPLATSGSPSHASHTSVISTPATPVAAKADAIDSFILSQVNRGR